MRPRLSDDLVLDGYRLVRRIGAGGFGEVWLCRSDAIGGWHALKFIHETTEIALDREFQALALYRAESTRLRSPHLVAIEHINRIPDTGLFYVMPLADGIGAESPEDPAWRPVTMATLMEEKAAQHDWFPSTEIITLMKPILSALQLLTDRGLVHRDVKPDNILFFGGVPCLGDVGLLARDHIRTSAPGTPGFACPSWYREGHPDMFAAGVTLFTLLTGHPPDRMGRASFKWPPNGESSLSKAERNQWIRIHAVIRRATEEKVSERFVDFKTMAEALEPGKTSGKKAATSLRLRSLIGVGLIASFASGAVVFLQRQYQSAHEDPAKSLEDSPATLRMTVTSEAANHLAVAIGEILSKSPQMADEGKITQEESMLCQEVLGQAYQYLIGGTDPEFPTVHREFEKLLAAVPELAKSPNARLALLALRKHSGLPDATRTDTDFSTYTAVSDQITCNGISCRSNLLRLLGHSDTAEEFLGECASRSSLQASTRSSALFERAKLRAENGQFHKASLDLRKSIEIVRGSRPGEVARRNEVNRLIDQYPSLNIQELID